jgi:acyl carrier protein
MSGPAQELSLPPDDAVLIERILAFIADAVDRPVKEIGADDDMYETLGMDSLGALLVFVDLAYEFGVPEPDPDRDLTQIGTARRLAEYARGFEEPKRC